MGDYAFLSDREVMALVGPSGDVEWLCLPRLDSPSVFGAILDGGAGAFRLGPADVAMPSSRRHLLGTMVLETSWASPTGTAVVRDVLLIGPRHDADGDTAGSDVPPAGQRPERVLLRTVRCVTGTVPIALACDPHFHYGRHPARWEHLGPGTNEGAASAEGTDTQLRLTTDMDLGFDGSTAQAHAQLGVGEARFCALSWADGRPPRTYGEANWRLVWAAHHWQTWTGGQRRDDGFPGRDRAPTTS